MLKKFENMFSRFDRIPACDRRTDGRMDIWRRDSPLCIASCARNLTKPTFRAYSPTSYRSHLPMKAFIIENPSKLFAHPSVKNILARDNCDWRRLRGCLCVAHDYERSATAPAPSALLHHASGTICPPTSFLHCHWPFSSSA